MEVWSERDEPNGGSWKDCTYSVGLNLLVAAGKTDFPLGIYTAAEREALERSDSRADETGANAGNLDEAIRNRYGIALRNDGRSLADLLAEPGLAIAVAGVFTQAPVLNKWQPGFAGGHRIAVVTEGRSDMVGIPLAMVYDPLAPWGYTGDERYVRDILAFAAGWSSPSELRFLRVGELAPAPTPPPPPLPPVDPTPFTQEDVNAMVLIGRQSEWDRVTTGATFRRVYDKATRKYVIVPTWPARP